MPIWRQHRYDYLLQNSICVFFCYSIMNFIARKLRELYRVRVDEEWVNARCLIKLFFTDAQIYRTAHIGQTRSQIEGIRHYITEIGAYWIWFGAADYENLTTSNIIPLHGNIDRRDVYECCAMAFKEKMGNIDLLYFAHVAPMVAYKMSIILRCDAIIRVEDNWMELARIFANTHTIRFAEFPWSSAKYLLLTFVDAPDGWANYDEYPYAEETEISFVDFDEGTII